ncbi:MAG: hypothetical protein JXN61_07815 [Sedimentisphaerales bacterium]|nr:hypothetical protein [Sedimentisphaerales bacterium]
MSMLRPMRDELFKYRKRKRKLIDGSVPGAPYVPYRRSRRPVSGLPYVSRGPGYHHDLYMWGNPRDYTPSLNAPAVQETEYDPYEPLDLPRIPRAGNPKLPHDIDDVGQDMPTPSYIPQDDLTLTERFLTAMGKKSEIERAAPEGPRFKINEEDRSEQTPAASQLPVELRSIDQLPSLEDLKDAFLTLVDVLPDDHPDLVNVRTAMRKVRDHHIALSEAEDAEMDNDPLQHDPLAEAEQFFDEQMALLEKSFDEPMEAEGFFEANGLEADLMPDGALPSDFVAEAQTLEGIIEGESPFEAPAPEFMDIMPDELLPDTGMPYLMPAGYDVGMIADEINQAIDQVAGQPVSDEMELDPFSPQYDPYMAGQQMFDEQMQYMADPFMMPGMGAMPGPCGPMGPMPGPMPGP